MEFVSPATMYTYTHTHSKVKMYILPLGVVLEHASLHLSLKTLNLNSERMRVFLPARLSQQTVKANLWILPVKECVCFS